MDNRFSRTRILSHTPRKVSSMQGIPDEEIHIARNGAHSDSFRQEEGELGMTRRQLPSVSVVIPTRDRPELLRGTLRSVSDQTLLPDEVIVVDDASSGDETRKVVEEFSSASVRYVRHPEGKGQNATRNTGIGLAKGDLIALLDDDDLWVPTKLEKQVPAFLRGADVGLVYCGTAGIDLATKRVHDLGRRSYAEGDLYRRELVRDVTASTSTYVVRRACFEEVGMFDETLSARTDWDMVIRISEKYRIACVPEVLVLSGTHSGARTSFDFPRVLEAFRLVFEKYASARRTMGRRVSLEAKAVFCYNLGAVYSRADSTWPWHLGPLHFLRGIFAWPFFVSNYVGLLKTFVPRPLRRWIRDLLLRWARAGGSGD